MLLEQSDASTGPTRTRRRFVFLAPALAALAYPFLLAAFHAAVASYIASTAAWIAVVAGLFITAAFLVPVVGLSVAARLARLEAPSEFEVRARQLAYGTIAAPPMFVLFGVGLGLLGSPIRDTTAWIGLWCLSILFAAIGGRVKSGMMVPPPAWLRVAHGISATILVVFVGFHLFNHMMALFGSQTHGYVMKAGRTVYRSALVEPIFIGMLVFQIGSGVVLANRWIGQRVDFYRAFLTGSGVYLAAFLTAHLNSALISARLVHGVETDWAWASGAPTGLIMDAWNIRLLPHYAYGAFFILMHLASGTRTILLAHGAEVEFANRLWLIAMAVSAMIASTIIGALLGLRL
jgi:hypothetical protein